jgi:hypothetical protein
MISKLRKWLLQIVQEGIASEKNKTSSMIEGHYQQVCRRLEDRQGKLDRLIHKLAVECKKVSGDDPGGVTTTEYLLDLMSQEDKKGKK